MLEVYECMSTESLGSLYLYIDTSCTLQVGLILFFPFQMRDGPPRLDCWPCCSHSIKMFMTTFFTSSDETWSN